MLLQKQEYKEDKIPTTGDAKFVRIGKGKNYGEILVFLLVS